VLLTSDATMNGSEWGRIPIFSQCGWVGARMQTLDYLRTNFPYLPPFENAYSGDALFSQSESRCYFTPTNLSDPKLFYSHEPVSQSYLIKRLYHKGKVLLSRCLITQPLPIKIDTYSNNTHLTMSSYSYYSSN
jgi:hypothetical protein